MSLRGMLPAPGPAGDPAFGPSRSMTGRRALAGFLDSLDIGRVHLVGLSWGGTLAQVFVSRHEDRVRSLVLADTYAGWTGSLGADAAARRLATSIDDAELLPAAFAERFVGSMFGPSPPAEAVTAMRAILGGRHPRAFRQMATALAEADTRDLLPRIGLPTLLLWGDQDARSPIAVGRAFEAAIRGRDWR